MTRDERDWLTGTDPIALLNSRHPVHTLGSVEPQTRRSRMYLIACARRAWERLPGVCRALVELAEAHADDPRGRRYLRTDVAPVAERLMNSPGESTDILEAHLELTSLRDSFADHEPALRALGEPIRTEPNLPFAPEEWRGLAALVYLPFDAHTPSFTWVSRALHDVHLVREVYGNPYRLVPFEPEWRTDTAVAFARGMYESREFSAMPIFADTLEDAGCNEPAVLDHCRDPNQVHTRGCWVLDLVLNLK
jgi:hypothetical protein